MNTELTETLRNALRQLAGLGYVVLPDFYGCQACAGRAIGTLVYEMVENGVPIESIRGVVFWHGQDERDRVEHGSFYMAFGCVPLPQGNAGITDKEAGKEICQVLNASGIATEWNGSAGTRIIVYERGHTAPENNPEELCECSTVPFSNN